MFVSTDDADDNGHCQGTNCGSLYVNVFRKGYADSGITWSNRVLAIGIRGSTANSSFVSWLNGASIPLNRVDWITSQTAFTNVNMTNYRMVYIPSTSQQVRAGLHMWHTSVSAHSAGLTLHAPSNSASSSRMLTDLCLALLCCACADQWWPHQRHV